MRKTLSAAVIAVALLAGCASNPSTTQVGMATGAVIGATITKNPWKGAVIGGMIGAGAGSAVEQNQRQQQVQYAPAPQQNNERTDCQKTSDRSWNNGRQTGDSVNERCTGRKTTYSYGGQSGGL